MAGVVQQGTCGWSDPTLWQCGRFYPSSAKTTEDRLRHYSLHMSCVEVNTSHYTIPAEDTVAKWVKITPTGFTFHFKVFQLFSSMSTSFGALPKTVRDGMEARDRNQLVRYFDVPGHLRKQIWDQFNALLRVVHQAGKLGVVMFQFQNGYKPTKENMDYIRAARTSLASEYPMAIEFRERQWTAPEHLDETIALLMELNIALVSADEYEHELYNRETLNSPHVMPIHTYITTDDFYYVRVHRRVGTNRLLPPDQIDQWAQRLKELGPKLRGPVYFMWGTDHEDQPLKNIANLSAAIGTQALDWRRDIANRKGSLGAMFAATATTSDGGHSKASSSTPPLAMAPTSSSPSRFASDDEPADDQRPAAAQNEASPSAKRPAQETPRSATPKKAKSGQATVNTGSIERFFKKLP